MHTISRDSSSDFTEGSGSTVPFASLVGGAAEV